MISAAHTPITPKLVEGLYTEAMVLADEARTYFDRDGQEDRDRLDPLTRVAFSCESLKVTTRLMHVVSWLLVRKAINADEMTEEQARLPDRRLGRASDSLDDLVKLSSLPARAQALIDNSRDLYERVRRLDEQLGAAEAPESPARALMGRLQNSF